MDSQDSKTSKSYDRFITIDKNDLAAIVRLSEPLVSTAIDDYGKSFLFHCDGDKVVVSYANKPYFLRSSVPNSSGSTVSDFFISIPLLRKVLASCGESLVIVEGDDDGRPEFRFEILGGLLYLETLSNLSEEYYELTFPQTENDFDIQAAKKCFCDMSRVVALSDRSSEKVVAIKDGFAFYNANFFSAKVRSPFSGGEEFVVYLVVGNFLGVLTEGCKSVKYSIDNNMLVMSDGNLECMMPIGLSVDDFYSPAVDSMLNFDATVTLRHSHLVNLVNLVNGLDYLYDILTYKFTEKELSVIVYSRSFENKTVYKFPYVEGTTGKGEACISSKVMRVVYSYLSDSSKYALTEDGICVSVSDDCKFVIHPMSR